MGFFGEAKKRSVDPSLAGKIESAGRQSKGLATEIAHKQAQVAAQPIQAPVRTGLQQGLGEQQQLVTGQMLGGALGQGALNQQMMGRALGQTPSVAQMALERGVGQATAGQQSIIGGQRSARGGLANIAMQQAGEAGQRAIAEEGGVAAAAERQAAEQAALQGQMQQQQLAGQNIQAQQQLEAQTELANQQLAQQMRENKQRYDQVANQQREALLANDTDLWIKLEQMKIAVAQAHQTAKNQVTANKSQFLGSVIGATGTILGGAAGTAMFGPGVGTAVGAAAGGAAAKSVVK